MREPAGLLDLRTEEQQDAPTRLPAYRLGQTSEQVVREVLDGLSEAGIEPALTGAAAGPTRTVNSFRLYVDLRRDPRRGADQAKRLRDEVTGF